MHGCRPHVLAAILGGLVAAPAAGQPPEPPPLPADQQRAVAAIERRESSYVTRDTQAPDQPVTGVSFGDPVTDDDLDQLRVFPRLKSLSVRFGHRTEIGLRRLAALPALESLNLYQSPITDNELAHLSALPALRWLTIQECPVTDAGLEHLARCPGLRFVHFADTQVTDAGVDRLKERLPYALISARRQGTWESDFDSAAAGLTWRVAVILAVAAVMAVGLRRTRWEQVQRRPWVRKVPLALAVVLITAVTLVWAVSWVRPVRDGNAATFWLRACGIDVGVRNPSPGVHRYYLPRDGWYIYYEQGFHGQHLSRVPAADAEALFPTVADRLRNAPPGALHPDVEAGFRAWEQAGRPDGATGFLVQLRQTWLDRLQRTNPRLYQTVLPEEDEFSDRWRRANRFHWNLWFEFTFLTGLILFAAWPWLRAADRWRWAIHVALLPPLLCLPFWLGYAPLTFTSSDEKGGVLYPVVVLPFQGLPWSELDTAILRALPKPLEPLSQTTGPMLSLSGFGAPGPVAVTGLGLLAGLAVLAGSEAVRRRAWIGSRVLGLFR